MRLLWSAVRCGVVGGRVKNVLESTLYIFVSRPFATGDRIELRNHPEGELEVYSIALLTTTCKDSFNKTIVIPNSLLLTSELINLSRSPQPVHWIPVLLDASTTGAQVQELKAAVERWVKERPAVWVERVALTVTPDGLGVNVLKAVLRVQMQGSWSDVSRNKANLVDILAFISETVAAMGVRAKAA